MELRQLRYFHAVAQAGHFRSAAARLNVAQPALSHQVRRLEQELGVRLFDRTSRSVRLTLAGERLLLRAERMLAEAANAREEMAELQGTAWGQLRIGVVSNSGIEAFGLAELLAEFSAHYPTSRTSIRNGATGALFDGLLEGDLQLAFVTLTAEAVAPPGITAEPFLVADVGLIVSTAHPLAQRAHATIESLAGERLILFGSPAMLGRSILERGRAADVDLDVAYEVSDVRMLRALASRELGVAVGPSWCVSANNPGLTFIRIQPAVTSTIALAWAERFYRPPAVQALLSLAEQRLMTPGEGDAATDESGSSAALGQILE